MAYWYGTHFMDINILHKTVASMMADGKGVLAIDESNRSVGKRLEPIGLEVNEENRRRFRNLFLATEGAERFMSGAILFDETMHQKSDDGTLFPALLTQKGIVPGIKVDKGAKDLQNFPDEKVTDGLDGLAERLKDYYAAGARFAKWRAVIRIGDGIPTQACLDANAFLLTRYAALCQEADIVPMVEPEVLLSGAHGIKRAYKETSRTLTTLFGSLKRYRIDLGGLILKTSMVVPGKDSGEVMDSALVGKLTAKCLKKSVPKEVGGVVFLSGGQSPDEATANLSAVAKNGPLPWGVTFSFARALQGPSLAIWKGDDANLPAARVEFLKRLETNSEARLGKV